MRPVPAHPASTGPPGHNPDGSGRIGRSSAHEAAAGHRPLPRGPGARGPARHRRDGLRLLRRRRRRRAAAGGNVAAWAHWQLHPRVLAGVAEVSTATTLLGTPVQLAGGRRADGDPGAGPPRGRGGDGPGRRRGRGAADPVLAGDVPARGRGRRGARRRCGGCRSTCCGSGRGRPSSSPGRWPRLRRAGADGGRAGLGAAAARVADRACTCPTTWRCPTWPATARRAPGRAASWRWSPRSSSRR